MKKVYVTSEWLSSVTLMFSANSFCLSLSSSSTLLVIWATSEVNKTKSKSQHVVAEILVIFLWNNNNLYSMLWKVLSVLHCKLELKRPKITKELRSSLYKWSFGQRGDNIYLSGKNSVWKTMLNYEHKNTAWIQCKNWGPYFDYSLV